MRSHLDSAASAAVACVTDRGFILSRIAGGFFLPASKGRDFILPRVAKVSVCLLHYIHVTDEVRRMHEGFNNTQINANTASKI